ncbi:hypothetical protein CSKR_201118 [Clonorchis sinensis]|uniref:Uncharacterized protein n=1 Tax=Clonorchis sinensis TaxID=79923 RepID=A0A8T1ML33_CLOSI|nr:hypothetical protein CSKR_201118 [Clonorchis sinensis]
MFKLPEFGMFASLLASPDALYEREAVKFQSIDLFGSKRHVSQQLRSEKSCALRSV